MARSILALVSLWAVLLLPLDPRAGAAPRDGDAIALFRDEIIDAPVRIRWKESSLSDETRFAVAASGLSWRPSWNEEPLIVIQKNRTFAYGDGVHRLNGYGESRRQRANKIAFAYALSLVLDPPEEDAAAWKVAYDYLRPYGADFDKALVGVLAAPEKLPLLYDYRHSAADVLVFRASPRLLPIFLGLAGSDDRYLRSRGVAALGLLGYRTQKGLDDSVKGLLPEPREMGISAVQIAMIDDVVQKAAEDKDYRVRAAAALAFGLLGGEENQAALQKLLKDKDYIQAQTGDKNSIAISFPVRAQAARSLERWGEPRVNDGSGLYDAKTVARVVRGAHNITNDARDAGKKVLYTVRFNEMDW